MQIDPKQYTGRPTDERIPAELAVYAKLDELGISCVRGDHEHADTIEFCHEVAKVLVSAN